MATVLKGATLTIVKDAGDWWLVRHRSTGSQGYVPKSAVEPEAGGEVLQAKPAAPAGKPAPGAPAASPRQPGARPATPPVAPGRPPAQPARPGSASGAAAPKKGSWSDVGWVAVNGLYQGSAASFDDSWTWPLNAETASATAKYTLKSSAAFDGGVGFRVWRNLAVGLGATFYSQNGASLINETLPHPLYLKRDRQVSGSDTAKRQETAVHLQVAWVAPVGRRMLVTIGAGPSYVTVRQGLVNGVRYGESYPFDEATFSMATSRTASKAVVGVNAGIDVGYFFTKTVGLGVTVRYAGGSVSVPGEGGSLSLKAGGLQAGLGLRVRLPKPAPKPPRKPPAKK